ncbi:hypothetical protein C5S30_06395 [ANME-1 cluster archaeon GoMg4]|nr:hypothetical protein [ANME-1 cluster archaeon GoMg4]
MSKMKRAKWPSPDLTELENELARDDETNRSDRVKRLKFVREEFGNPTDMLLVGGIPAGFAIYEMAHSYVVGDFMATVLLAQVFVEHSLGGSFIMSGDDDTATGGFSKLISQSLSKGLIPNALAEKLHKLRKMRNPYSHPNPGLTPRSYVGRMMEKKVYSPEDLAEQDARFALEIVVDFLRHGSPNWHPKNDDSPSTEERAV